MKKQNLLFLSLALLTSCGSKAYAVETINKPSVFANKTVFSDSVSSKLSNLIETSVISDKNNFVLSPINSSLIDSYKNDKEAFSSLYALVNQKENKFSLTDNFSVASSSTINDKNVDNVSYFEGTVDELNNSLSRFYDRKISLANSGTYYLSLLELQDYFLVPEKTEDKLPFNSNGTYTYVSMVKNGKYEIKDNYTIFEVSINATKMRILLPNTDVDISSISLSEILKEPESSGRISVKIPEFNVSSEYTDASDGYTYHQENFTFNHYGVKGSSFTVNGPTSTSPDYDLTIDVNHSFYFMSMLEDAPLFAGKITTL